MACLSMDYSKIQRILMLPFLSPSALTEWLATLSTGTSGFHGRTCTIKHPGNLYSHPGSSSPLWPAYNIVTSCVSMPQLHKPLCVCTRALKPEHGCCMLSSLTSSPQACACLSSLPPTPLSNNLKVDFIPCLMPSNFTLFYPGEIHGESLSRLLL